MRARGLWRLLICITCAGIAFAGTAPGADAKPGYYVLSPSVYLELVVQGSNGYTIEVTGSGKQVDVWVGRRGSGLAKYHVPGRARMGAIKANLGSLGRIDLRFDAKSVETDQRGPKGCHGKPSVYELGSFRGTMRFRGEGGYTRLSAKRVQGSVSHDFRQVCKKPDWLLPDPHESHKPAKEKDDGVERELNVLGAAMSSRHRSVSLHYISIVVPESPSGKRLSLVGAKAEVHERRSRIAIERSALVLADEGALLFGPAGESPTATLNLPLPFAGSGTYGTSAEGTPTWSGSLRVHLPGATVALTGADFVAALCQGTRFGAVSRCMRPVEVEAKRGRH